MHGWEMHFLTHEVGWDIAESQCMVEQLGVANILRKKNSWIILFLKEILLIQILDQNVCILYRDKLSHT